ncbi:hypothetical protein SprV_0401697300 [Sparganum proliferum]
MHKETPDHRRLCLAPLYDTDCHLPSVISLSDRFMVLRRPKLRPLAFTISKKLIYRLGFAKPGKHPSNERLTNHCVADFNKDCTKLSPVAPCSWAVISGHTPDNSLDRRAKPDNPRSNRPERRRALVARELARYKVDIAALSETRFSEQGQLEEVGAGYTFFWSGRPKAER